MPGFVKPRLQNLGWTSFWIQKLMGTTSSNLNTESVPHRRRQTDEA